MKKKYLIFLLSFLLISNLWSQDFCGGDHFYDSGGANGTYQNNEDITTVISSNDGSIVSVTFISFSLENPFDFLTVYDGPDISATVLGIFSGETLPGPFTSSHATGSLTFRFTSDTSVLRAGWDAIVNCTDCPIPQNTNATNIGFESATLNWNNGSSENNWEIEYGLHNFTQGNGTFASVATQSLDLNNLNSNTAYDFYIRANCGSIPGENDSVWAGPYEFSTIADYCNGDHFYDTGGANGTYQNNENYDVTITDSNNAIMTVNFLSFSLENNFDFLTIYDGPDANATELGVFSGSNLPGSFTSTHASGSLTFRFTSDGSQIRDGWDAEVTCESVTCPKPQNLTAFNIGNTSVDLNWDNGGTENQWEIEYGSFGFEHGSGTIISSNSKPFTLNNLDQGTKTQAYVRAVCTSGVDTEFSHWSLVTTFVTSCGNFEAPFSEDFSSDITPGCWFEFGDEFWNYGTDATFAASNAGDHTSGEETNYTYIDGSSPTGVGHISHIITPFIDVSGLTDTSVQFAVFSHNNNDGSYNTLDVVLNEQNGNSTNLLHVQQSLGSNWKVYTFDVGFITDTHIQLEFIVEENSSGNAFYNDILIDDIKIDESSVLQTNDSFLTQLKAYPNPVTNILTINSDALISEVSVFDILGKNIFKQQQNNTAVRLDFSNFSKGIYFVKIMANDHYKIVEIVKQ